MFIMKPLAKALTCAWPSKTDTVAHVEFAGVEFVEICSRLPEEGSSGGDGGGSRLSDEKLTPTGKLVARIGTASRGMISETSTTVAGGEKIVVKIPPGVPATESPLFSWSLRTASIEAT